MYGMIGGVVQMPCIVQDYPSFPGPRLDESKVADYLNEDKEWNLTSKILLHTPLLNMRYG